MAKRNISANEPVEGAVLPASDADKILLGANEVEVDSSNSFEQVLQYDKEGKRIFFACERGKFLDLSADEVAQLSRFTRITYASMKAANSDIESRDPEFEEINRRLTIDQIAGSANDKLDVKFKDPSDAAKYEIYHFRPDNFGKAISKGWKQLSPRQVDALLPNDTNVSIRENGKTELTAFYRPKEIRAEVRKRNAEAAARNAEVEAESYRREVEKSKGKVLTSADVPDASKWKDI